MGSRAPESADEVLQAGHSSHLQANAHCPNTVPEQQSPERECTKSGGGGLARARRVAESVQSMRT